MTAGKPRLSPAQQAEAAVAIAKGPPGPWATHAMGRLLGRGPRPSLAGPAPEGQAARRLLPTGGSQGNAGHIRGAPTAGPGYGGGRHDGTYCAIPEPTGGRGSRDYGTFSRTGPAFHNGSTIVYDRHIMAKTGTERQQAHPDATGGQGLSPLADGPVRPVHMQVNRVMAPRYGNTSTRRLDNQGPFAVTRDSAGRAQPLGIQDGSPWSRKYGGTPGLTYITGMRGSAGVVSPAEPDAPGDGPQLIRGGSAHGLHSHSQPNAELRTKRIAATPQQRRPRRSLPKNASRAGQAWSQNAQQLGGQARPVPRTPGRLPGQAGRVMGRG
jgi:hypothetical protein